MGFLRVVLQRKATGQRIVYDNVDVYVVDDSSWCIGTDGAGEKYLQFTDYELVSAEVIDDG